jgi:hypothetical protein
VAALSVADLLEFLELFKEHLLKQGLAWGSTWQLEFLSA